MTENEKLGIRTMLVAIMLGIVFLIMPLEAVSEKNYVVFISIFFLIGVVAFHWKKKTL